MATFGRDEPGIPLKIQCEHKFVFPHHDFVLFLCAEAISPQFDGLLLLVDFYVGHWHGLHGGYFEGDISFRWEIVFDDVGLLWVESRLLLLRETFRVMPSLNLRSSQYLKCKTSGVYSGFERVLSPSITIFSIITKTAGLFPQQKQLKSSAMQDLSWIIICKI